MKKKIFLPLSFIALAMPLALSQRYVDNKALYISEFTTRANYISHGLKVNEQIGDEGIVLLKNDGFLPFKKVKKISIVGKASARVVYSPYGASASGQNLDVRSVSLRQAFIDGGFTINEDLEEFYANNRLSGPGRTNGNDSWKGNSQVQIGETPISNYTPEVLASMDNYNDAAIMVITREGSEGCDVKAIDARDFDPRRGSGATYDIPEDGISKKHALQLSDNEEDLLNELHKHFNHIVVLLNSANIFECDVFENDPKVSGVLWTGFLGQNGATSIVNILTGKANPSGRTVDTWTRDFKEDPTYQNFGDNSQTSGKVYHTTIAGKEVDTYVPQDTMFTSDGYPVISLGTDKVYNNHDNPRWVNADAKVVQGGLNGVKPSAYVSYEEDIYRDYRYYETRYADLKANNKAKADEWYQGKQGVTYPFGYGLSYTTFEHKIVSSNYANNSEISDKTKRIEITVKVKNVGQVAGKDVVQAYFKAPYYKGGIEKPYEVLCAFGKTTLLQPRESQNVKLSFYLQDVANYDYKDKNNNGFKGYELDEGTYYVSINKNAHEELASIKLNLKKGIAYEEDRITGKKVENRFSNNNFNNSLPSENDVEFTLMRRDAMNDTFPTHPTIVSRTLNASSKVEDYLTHPFHIAEVDLLDTDYYSLKEARISKQTAIEKGWKQEKPENYQMIDEMRNIDLDDPRWDTFINQLTYADLSKFTTDYKMGSTPMYQISKPAVNCNQTNPIIRFFSNAIIAATFNVDLAKTQGECVGIESALTNRYAIWYQFAVLRRSPFGGKNFEFYSADPLLTGKILSNYIRATREKGVVCYVAGFVGASQEKNREGVITYVSEQTLRELDMKPFQMVVEEGNAIGIQTSYNRLGLTEAQASYSLLTKVLRGEWNFQGSVISDMHHAGSYVFVSDYYECPDANIVTGINGIFDSNGYRNAEKCSWDVTAFDGKGAPVYEYKGKTYESYSWWGALRRAVKEELYTYVNSYIPVNKMIQSSEEITISDDEIQIYLGEEIDVTISATNKLHNGVLVVDKETPLPEGLTFKDGKISGKPTKEGNYTVNILLKADGNADDYWCGRVIRFEILPAKEGAKKSGCGGSIVGTSVMLVSLTLIGTAFIFLKKRREIEA